MRCRHWLPFLLILFSVSKGIAAATVASESSIGKSAQAILQREVNEDSPGAVALIARGDQVIFRAARGRADVELATPLEPQHVFRIGSITKTFTAATILKLVAANELSLDDRVSKFMPDFPDGQKISIAQLLDHTAGVSDAWDANPANETTTAELVSAIKRQPADFPSGTDWRYSNSGYILLGAIIERVTGKPWHVATKELIVDPLGMTHTGYHGDTELVPGRIEGYSVDETGAIVRAPYASMTGPNAAGALSSTVDDLFVFMRALTRRRLLPAGLYQQMTTAKTTSSGQTVAYGYGVMLGTVRGEAVIEHNGGIDGFSSQLTFFPNQDVTVVVLANTDAGGPNPRSLAHRLGALAIGRPYASFRVVTLDSKSLVRLAGSYRISSTSVRTVSVRDGRLFVRRDQGPERQLAAAEGGILYFPGDGTDYFRVIRDAKEDILALDFFVDGMAPAQRELRVQ